MLQSNLNYSKLLGVHPVGHCVEHDVVQKLGVDQVEASVDVDGCDDLDLISL